MSAVRDLLYEENNGLTAFKCNALPGVLTLKLGCEWKAARQSSASRVGEPNTTASVTLSRDLSSHVTT